MIGSDLEMMRKRYDFLSELVKDYKSVDNFFEDKKEWFDIVGIELTKAEKFLGVYFELGDGQYQFFFNYARAGPDNAGRPNSDVSGWVLCKC